MHALWARLGRSPPLLAIAAGSLLGDAAAGALAMPYGSASIAVVLLLTAVLLCSGAAARRIGLAVLAMLYCALAADAVYRPRLPDDHLVHLAPARRIAVEGVLVDDSVQRGWRGSMIVRVEQVLSGTDRRSASGNLRLSVRRLEASWRRGQRVRLHTSLRLPRNFGTPGEFDYTGHLARRRVYVTGYVDSDRSIEALTPATDGSALQRWRDDVAGLILMHVSAPAAGVLQALVIGREDHIDSELRQAFSRVGVSHVLSISGLHVGLVSSTGYLVARWLLARSEWLLLRANVPKCAVGLSIVPVLLYAGIAGSNIATTRSVVMILVFLGAVVVDRQRDLIISLAAAAVGIIAASPGVSLEISFQLSFAAVWALVLATKRFWLWWPRFAEKRLLRLRQDWRARIWRPVLLYFVVSASALVASTPLTALHFNQVVPIAPLANALVVPPLGSAAVMLGLLAAFAEPLSQWLAIPLVYAAGLSVHLGLLLVGILDAVPFGHLRVVTPSLFEVCLGFAAIAVVLTLAGRTRWLALTCVVCAAAANLALGHLRRDSGELRITFLSIGQGDAAVVELPSRKVLVIDGGGIGDGFDVGERVLARFLWSRRIRRVHAVVISHPQFDHYDGLRFVTRHFAPREVWSSGEISEAKAFQALARTWKEGGAQHQVLRRDSEWQDGDVQLAVWWPPAVNDRNPNNNSLVFQLRYAGVRVLFTGDIETPAEQAIAALLPADELRSDVLKVAHHGSRTSSTGSFTTAVAPRLSVISLGAGNRFGFPDAAVVRRLQQQGAMLRTDRDGAVEVRIGRRGEVEIAAPLRGYAARLPRAAE